MNDFVDTIEMQKMVQRETNETPTIEEARNKILRYGSSELEQAHKDWGKPETPRIFTYKSGSTQVDIVGTAHTHHVEPPTPDASQEIQDEYKMMQEVITHTARYLDATPSDKALVMVEGFRNNTIPRWITLKEAASASGEMGVSAFMAQEKNVEVVSPEVDTKVVIEKLKEQGIPSDQIALFYSLRALPDLIRQEKYEVIPRAIYGAQLSAQAEWVPPFTPEETQNILNDPQKAKSKAEEVLKICAPKLNEVMKEINGQRVFDEDTVQVVVPIDDLLELTSPRSDKFDTVLNKIARIDNEARDDYLLDEIYKAKKRGKSPLIVFGGTHTLKINPALQYLHS